MCANPLLAAATPMCSEPGWETTSKNGLIYCNYMGERTSYDSAQSICQENGLEQSYPWIVKGWNGGPCAEGISSSPFRSWTTASCDLKVKVSLESGEVAIVHSPGADRSGVVNVESMVDVETLNFFAVPWEGNHPTESDCLGMPTSCVVHGTEYCICDIDATESAVYSSAAEVLSLEDLMETLHIGAMDPASFDAMTYNNLGCSIQDVTVYSAAAGDSCASLSTEAIFALEQNSKQYFLRNIKSVVTIPEPGSNFSFRNPVHYISLCKSTFISIS